MVQFNYLLTIRAAAALRRNSAAQALEILRAAAPYELDAGGSGAFLAALYPVYVRGSADLAAQQGREAAAEFQKILDHGGVVINEPIAALARLGLARGYTLQGDTGKARIAYEDFFELWKDADADVPILRAAKTEYSKLK
jgi:eukaryotic-like serine/threonine-protein kinase